MLLSVGAAVAGCRTDVASPDVVKPSSLQGAGALPEQLAGAYGDFALAYIGSTFLGTLIDDQAQEGQVLVSGLLTDEFEATDFFTNHLQIDLRNQSRNNASLDDMFRLVQRARASSEKTAAAYAQYDSTDPGRLTVLNQAGFTYVWLAESFCGNVPISNFDASGAFVYGAPVGTDSLLHLAKNDFQLVMTIAATTDVNSTSPQTVSYELTRAQIGMARALTFQGQLDSATIYAALVPSPFSDSIERSQNSPTESNGIYNYTTIDPRYAVTSGQGLPYLIDAVNGDPRINIGQTSANFPFTIIGDDDETVDTIQQKYPGYSVSVQLATSAEARLIQAEDALVHGNTGMALAYINDARSDVASFPQYLTPGLTLSPRTSLPSNFDLAVDTLFKERAYDLWMMGHREGDLRRLTRPVNGSLPGYGYGRPQNTVWPSGTYFKPGNTYGTNVALLIPQTEDDNPQYSDAGCNNGNTP
jgi:starch-binding outer membrane protein, SusD/RagB family